MLSDTRTKEFGTQKPETQVSTSWSEFVSSSQAGTTNDHGLIHARTKSLLAFLTSHFMEVLSA